jgi:hypothetical protein
MMNKKAGFWDAIILIFVFMIAIFAVLFLGPRLIEYFAIK